MPFNCRVDEKKRISCGIASALGITAAIGWREAATHILVDLVHRVAVELPDKALRFLLILCVQLLRPPVRVLSAGALVRTAARHQIVVVDLFSGARIECVRNFVACGQTGVIRESEERFHRTGMHFADFFVIFQPKGTCKAAWHNNLQQASSMSPMTSLLWLIRGAYLSRRQAWHNPGTWMARRDGEHSKRQI